MATNGKMKALRKHADGLRIDEVEVPSPGPKQVLIKVHATGITADELEWSETKQRENPIPGHDVSGTIAKVGSEVSGFKEGDEIFALTSFSRDGAAAEYMIANSAELAKKPSNLSFEEAAAIPLAALTAWQAIFQHADAKPGKRILITGAGGGTGVMFVQIASFARLMTTGTCSESKKDLVKSLGAQEVFDYNKTPVESLSHNYDIVVDLVGGDTLQGAFKVLKGGGILVSIHRPMTDDEKAHRPDAHSVFFIVDPDGDELKMIAHLCEDGQLKPVLQTVMPLEKGAEAFDLLGQGHTKGKIILKPGQST